MPSSCLPDNQNMRIHAYAWLCSLSFHLSFLVLSIEFIRHVTSTPIVEPFRWEVALVSLSSTATESIPADTPKTIENQTDLPFPSNSPSHPPENQATSDLTTSEEKVAVPRQIMAETERPQPPALQEQPAGLSQSPAKESQSVPAKAEEVRPQQTRERQMEQDEVVHPAFEQSEMPRGQTDGDRLAVVEPGPPVSPPSLPPVVSAPPAQIGREVTGQAPPETVTSAETIHPDRPSSQGPAGVETQSERTTTDPSAPLHAQVQALSSGSSVARPVAGDFGWLQRALSKRLEQLKRESRPFLDVSGRKKVLLRLVILDGGDLGELKVERSSGEDHLDQEAIRLVQRAFPMALDYALSRSQVVVRVPITYSLSSD